MLRETGGGCLCAPNDPLPFTRERLHALAGRLSYLPATGTGEHPALLEALDRAFDTHAAGGAVELEYRTLAFLAQL